MILHCNWRPQLQKFPDQWIAILTLLGQKCTRVLRTRTTFRMWHRTTFPVIVAERKMADFQPYYCMLITITLRDYDRAQLARTTSCHKLYYKARIMTHANNIILNIQRILASILKCKALNSSKFIPEYKGRYIATRQPSHKSSHAMSHRIFGDVEEREQGERNRWLSRETTAS